MYEIEDIRISKDFKNISFSNYKKSDVKKELVKSILDEKIEDSCYWSAELLCAGHYKDLWEILLFVFTNNIHLGNVTLPIYLNMRYENFKEIVVGGYIDNEIFLRNNKKIRQMFCEIICIFCFSKKKSIINNNIKLNDDDFNFLKIQEKCKADNLNYSNNFILPDDGKELIVCINEFSYHLSKNSSNTIYSCYWVNWLIEYDSKCKKQKRILKCERRPNIQVNEKLQMEPIWIIWQVLEYYIKEKNNLKLNKIYDACLNLFCLRYSIPTNKKRRDLIYFIIMLINEDYQIPEQIIHNKDKINIIIGKIDNIYKQIKKHEKSPKMDYMFNGAEKNNLSETLKKLETMNTDLFLPTLKE